MTMWSAPGGTWTPVSSRRCCSAGCRRLRLPDGRVWTGPGPWAEKGSRGTLRFEQLAVRVRNAARTLTQAAQWLRLDWDAGQRIMERGSPAHRPPLFPSASSAVGRGLERRSVERVGQAGLDEKSFRRRQSYISVLVAIDAEAPRVLEVAEGRRQADAALLLEELPARPRAKVEAAAIDLSAAAAGAVRAKLPRAEMVPARFPVSKLLGEAARPSASLPIPLRRLGGQGAPRRTPGLAGKRRPAAARHARPLALAPRRVERHQA